MHTSKPPRVPQRSAAARLILGGHSFIQQLGSDPRPEESEQVRIVETCLDAGITWFDTTYQPERVALGRVLKALGRRDEAVIIAWNFFQPFDTHAKAPAGGANFYRAESLTQMLTELETDHIDYLVVHPMGDPAGDQTQERLAEKWQRQGRVGKLGMWCWPPVMVSRHRGRGPYDFMVHPRNIATGPAADAALTAARQVGLEVLACSPFVRGYELEKLVAVAVAQHGTKGEDARRRLSDHMLRYSLFAPMVDRLIVSMRRSEWVHDNLESVAHGPLSEAEQLWLSALCQPQAPSPEPGTEK